MNGRTPAPVEPPDDPVVELCAFRVGDEEYVIDLRRVREILNLTEITAVPKAPEGIEGVMNVRGHVIPVVDVRKRLGVVPAIHAGRAVHDTPTTVVESRRDGGASAAEAAPSGEPRA